MRVSCTLEFDYDSEEEAQAVAKAVEVDNEGFVKMDVEGKKIISTAESESISSLIHTLDDFLSCVSVAERVVEGK
jgi:tRNA threonylcarbamoyladenosine modification (KEOPS) complex  Pcc1 subunit